MMETFGLYLIKSVIWLTGFALVYLLFLRNERFFELNRSFLIAGIIAALIFPFITISYKVVLPVEISSQSVNAVVSANQITTQGISSSDFRVILFYLYLSGLLFVAFMITRQVRSLLTIIKRAGKLPDHHVRLIKTAEYDTAFSLFSYVFVNPSVTELEFTEIMNHEMVHIRQKHWLDLMLVQLLCIMQWFNPVVWIYIRLIRQNHEYIADKVALQRTSDPAIYRAALLNQIVGSPVISLVNSFNYSLNKKRFTMMENIFSPPYRKMKLLFILPVFALVFYAFAKPDYQYSASNDSNANQSLMPQSSDKKIKGTIVTSEGNPLQGAHIIVTGTTIGTTSDANGNFSLEKVPANAALALSYVGYKSKVIKSEFVSRGPIKMEADTISLAYTDSDLPALPSPPPPPPPSQPLKIRNTNGGPPSLVVLDGVIKDVDVNSIDPETIESMTVLKDNAATDKYGDKGKDGVIEITSKKNDSVSDDKVFIAVEELPQYPGGTQAMNKWITDNLKYPEGALKDKAAGKVEVTFIVTKTGKVSLPVVHKSLHPLLDDEAVRVIGLMPSWKPGTQDGTPVDVQLKVPVEFKLK